MRVLVTGGTGFIGSHLAKNLISRKEVTGVRVLDADLPLEFLGNVEYLRGDIRCESVCREAVQETDSVVHLAAKASVPDSIDNPKLTNDVNVTGTLNMLRATAEAGATSFTFASSSAVYGDRDGEICHESAALSALSPYAASKIAGEAYVQSFYRTCDLNITIFRFFNVYGPGQDPSHVYAAAIPRFISSVLRSESLKIFGDGKQTRDFVYIDDVVDALTRSIFAPSKTPYPINLATGVSVEINDIIDLISSFDSNEIELYYRGKRSGDIEHSRADIRSLLNLYPDLKLTGLVQGIESTYQSHKDLLGQ